MKKVNSVEEYISNQAHWKKELTVIRSSIQKIEQLEEGFKWSMPTYTYKGKNVIGFSGFKEHFGVWFFQGGLLKDPHQVLMNAQEGKTKAMRQLRLQRIEDINEQLIIDYAIESIENFKQGKFIKPQKNKPLIIPTELNDVFKSQENVQVAFEQLSLSKKREYCEYINEAKREATKEKRILKIIPMIISGKGLNDQYR